MSDSDDRAFYIRKISEDTARYARDLLKENQKLRALAVRLDGECRRFEAELERQLNTYQCDRADLERQLEQLETESKKYLEDYLELEQQNTNLANLYVASYRLHGSLDRVEVLAGIQEIVVNLIGSEEMALFEMDDANATPRLSAAVGLDIRTFHDLPPESQERILSSLRSGQVWIRDGEANGNGGLTASVPLFVDGSPTGVVAVFRLLEQKTEIEPIDRELFSLLATHAATALYATTLLAVRTVPAGAHS